MLVDWHWGLVAGLNVLGVPLIHLGVSWLFQQMPRHWFEKPCRFRQKAFFEKVFRVRSWRDHLPDAAPWVGGEAKATLQQTPRAELPKFAAECLRGIYAHWAQFFLLLVFMIWTPAPWAWIFFFYSMLLNLPCIVNLSYTRARLAPVLALLRQ